MVILLVYTAIFTPLRISFVDESDNWNIIDDITDILFMTDILINFFLPVEDDSGKLLYNKKDICK